MSDPIDSFLEATLLAAKTGEVPVIQTSAEAAGIIACSQETIYDWESDPWMSTKYTPEDHAFFDSLGEV